MTSLTLRFNKYEVERVVDYLQIFSDSGVYLSCNYFLNPTYNPNKFYNKRFNSVFTLNNLIGKQFILKYFDHMSNVKYLLRPLYNPIS